MDKRIDKELARLNKEVTQLNARLEKLLSPVGAITGVAASVAASPLWAAAYCMARSEKATIKQAVATADTTVDEVDHHFERSAIGVVPDVI